MPKEYIVITDRYLIGSEKGNVLPEDNLGLYPCDWLINSSYGSQDETPLLFRALAGIAKDVTSACNILSSIIN